MPEDRDTKELLVPLRELAQVRAEVHNLRAELAALREQLEHLADVVEQGSSQTVIGGRRARIVIEVAGGD